MRISDSTASSVPHSSYIPNSNEDDSAYATDHQLAQANLSTATTDPASAGAEELSVGDRGPRVNDLQQALLDAGFDPKGVDGQFGPNTLIALQDYQQSRIDSIDSTLANGVPPLARPVLDAIKADLRTELDNNVAGNRTFDQLGLAVDSSDSPLVDPPVEPEASTPTEIVGSIGPDSSDADVRRLQRGLVISGHDIAIDGDFGPQTADALLEYQQDQIQSVSTALRNPLPPLERETFQARHDGLVDERDAGVAGTHTMQSLSAEAMRVEGAVDFSEVDPNGVLLDERMNPVFADKIRAVLADLVEQGFEPEIHEGYRDFERQEQLYAQGRTAPGDIVTGARGGRSWHQYGLAVDIVHQGNTNKWRESDLWAAIGEAGEKQGLYWGGNFGDRPHLEFHPGYTAGQAGVFDDIFSDRVATQSELESMWAELGL